MADLMGEQSGIGMITEVLLGDECLLSVTISEAELLEDKPLEV